MNRSTGAPATNAPPTTISWTWSPAARLVVFALAATSIACLIAEFYRPGTMRHMTWFLFLPATVALLAIALADLLRGVGQIARRIGTGALAGLVAALAYDAFRLPFVFARAWGIDGVVPAMPLFKVFPGFGMLILNQDTPTLAAHLVGWAYHFSNGVTFGVMYVALLGATPGQRRWAWGVLFAAGLELGMLFTPYPRTFAIPLTATFVIVTMAAHAVFGAVMGLVVRRITLRELLPLPVEASAAHHADL